MSQIFVGEYGKTLFVETGHNLSSATGLEIHVSGPSSASSFVNSASVSVLTSNVTSSACDQIFSANKTVRYILNAGDIVTAGTHKVWIQADFGALVRLISTSFKFLAKNPG